MYINILEQYMNDHMDSRPIKRVDGSYFTKNNYLRWSDSPYFIGSFSICFWVRENNSNEYALRISDFHTFYYLKWPDGFHGPEDENFLLGLLDGCSMDEAIEKLLNIVLQNNNFGCKYGLK